MADILIGSSPSVGTATTIGSGLLEIHPRSQNSQAVASATGDGSVIQLLVGTGFEVRVFDRTDPNGSPIAVLPRTTVKFEDLLSDVGAGSVDIVGEVDTTVFAKDNVVRIYWEGVERFAFRARDVLTIHVDDNEVVRRQVVGPKVPQGLDDAIVYPAGWGGPSPQTVRSFSNVTRAYVLLTLLEEAQARGAATEFTRYLWNATRDSNNALWTDVNQLDIPAGTTLLELFNNFATLGFEWYVDSQFRIHIAPSLGTDRSSSVIVQPGGAIKKQETLTTRAGLKTVVLSEDQNGGVSEVSDLAAVGTWGRREAYVKAPSAVDAATRANYGNGLLQTWKKETNQRTVAISTTQVGRKPFVDFGMGDIIGAKFGGVVYPFKVLAIAMESTEDGEACEVVLESLIKKSTLAGGQAASSLGTDSSSTIFAENSAQLTIGTSQQSILLMTVQAFTATFGKAGLVLRGISSVAQQLTVEVVKAGTVLRTFQEDLIIGKHTFGIPFILSAIPEGTSEYYLRVNVSVGTFIIDANQGQFWIEGRFLNGGLGGSSPEMEVIEVVDGYYDGVTVTPTLAVQTPLGLVPPESVDGYYDDATTTIIDELIVTIPVSASADDGMTKPTPSFNNLGTSILVGDDGATASSAWYRFVLPTNLAGRTVTYARLKGFGDAVDGTALTTIRASDEAAATAPVDRADYLARPRTTASVNWNAGTASAVAFTSSDFAAVIQELVDTYGSSLTSVLILHEDNGSPLNNKMSIRSKDNVANQPPTLEIRVLGPL